MNENKDEVPYGGAPYMKADDGPTGTVSFTGMDEPGSDSEDSYVGRRGFAVNVGDRPMPDVPFPFITISGDRIVIRVRDGVKDVFRGVQMHLNLQESYYAEIEVSKPKTVIDAMIRFAEQAELASYTGQTHTGPIPVYAMCMKDEQADPILSELEKRMAEIKAEDEELSKIPLE